MLEHLSTLLDVLAPVKLMPRRTLEADVLYGYVAPAMLNHAVAAIDSALSAHGYEVHRCEWSGEAVLLALSYQPKPIAIRLTSSATERYNLYALSRPQNAQALWQWAHMMVRQQVREQRARQIRLQPQNNGGPLKH